MKSLHVSASLNNLKPIKLSDLRGQVTDFDLYIDIAGRAVLYAPEPYTWSDSEKERLLNDGHVVLFYEPSNDSKVNAYLEAVAAGRTVHLARVSEDEAKLSELTAEFSKQLYDLPVAPGEELPFIKNLAHSIVHEVLEHPQTAQELGKLQSHDTFTFYHSARVAAYATAIAYRMSLTDEEALADIALGCILHDLGHLRIEPQILEKAGKLDEREWEIMKKHPEWGYEMIEGFEVGFVTSEIILHHHEREDGCGYPHGISGKELLQEVKIVTFADVFDALSSRRPYQDQKTLQESLDFIEQIALDYLDRDAFRVMREIVQQTVEQPSTTRGACKPA